MSRWHPVYGQHVLQRNYRFSHAHLMPYFFDALIAYAAELAQIGLPHSQEATKLLGQARGQPIGAFDGQVEDVFYAIYSNLEQRVGAEVAGVVRQGLSRNDLDLTVYRAYARMQGLQVARHLLKLRKTLLALAKTHAETLTVAQTHYQSAQPHTLGHYFAAIESLLSRDFKRLWSAIQTVNSSPLGASALAGNPYPIDRQRLAERLGFGSIVENTYDAVAAGDWGLELGYAVAGLASSLSRLHTDLLGWAREGVLQVEERIAQGSSIMPQKRNPVVLEHARSLLAKAIGHSQALLLLNHSTPFGDHNDHSTEMVEPLGQMCQTLSSALELTRIALLESRFSSEQLQRGLEDGSVLASELADALVGHCQIPLTEAHHRVKHLMAVLHAQGKTLRQATPEDFATHLGCDSPALQAALDPRAFLQRRQVQGGVAFVTQQRDHQRAQGRLEADIQTYLHLYHTIHQRQQALRHGVNKPVRIPAMGD
ncbi:MAG: lyase family protein [Meiothermus sp.]|nr:lyase family protein [Meiothermus sp.]